MPASHPSLAVAEGASPADRPSLLRGRWLWATIVVMLGLALFIRLGIWQLERLQQRQAQNAHLMARLNQPPLALNGAAVDPAEADLRRGVVRGTYDFSQEIVLRNQALNGAPGVHLLTPLRITDSDTAVLVDRGWVPLMQSAPSARTEFDHPAGQVEVRGLVHRSQSRLNSLSPADPLPSGPNARADEWFRVDIPRIQPQIPYPLLGIYVEEGEPNVDSTAAPAPGGLLPIHDIQIDLSNGPHLGYAIQWFAFAVILLAGYIAFFRRSLQPSTIYPEGAMQEEEDHASVTSGNGRDS